MKPIHAHRPGGTTTAAPKKSKPVPIVMPCHLGPEDEFMRCTHSAWMAKVNWPPGFVSRGNWTSSRHAAPHVIAAQSRSGEGFSANPIGLKGERMLRAQWEANQAREAKS